MATAKAKKSKTTAAPSSQEDQPKVTLDEALRLAQGHHQCGNYILAERTYRDILRAVPDHYPTTQFLGVLLFQSGNFDEAKHFLELSLKTKPEDHLCWNNYGGILAATGEHEKALHAYDKALKIEPEYLDALNNKSYALWTIGKHEEAEAACRKAIDIAPENITALVNMGIILSKRIKYEESLEVWEKASRINPKEPLIWINWGNTLREMGRLQLSEEKCRKATELAPENPEALNNLANALRDLGKAEEAIELYRKATNIKPNYPEAHSNMAIAYADGCRFEDAAVAARYAVAFKDDFAEGYSNLSKALCQLGKYDPAHRAAQRAIHLDPENAATYLDLADVLLRADQLDDGEAVLQEALKREPNSPRAYLKLSEIRENMTNFEAAHEAIDTAIKLSPDMANLWLRKAMIFYVEGLAEKALESIDNALTLRPKWPLAMQHKAEILVSINRNEEAEKLSREVISLASDLPGPYSTLASLKKFKSEDDEDFKAMKKLEEKIESFGQDLTSIFFFTLSDVYEQLGQHEKSFEYLDRANAIRRKSIPYVTWKDLDFHSLIRDKYTPEFIAQHEGRGSDSEAPIFIVGMPRSGSTLTEQIISSHPQVFGAGELPTLGKVHKLVALEGEEDTLKLANMYLNLAHGENGKKYKRITDKMPANYMYIGFIHCLFPNAKIIHTRRDAIDTCLSCYKQNFARGQYWSYNLEELAAAYKRYEGLMEYWREILPGRFLEIDYEETVNDLEAQARRLIDYIGLEWDDACLQPHKQKRTVLTASKAQVTKPVYKTSVEKWRRYEKQLQPLIKALNS
ncbi:MAG TPA: sulfotransferase [Rhodospirillaceae bacterium]|nr:sulfotransferase [Rhodospirillaceae bacterium]